MTSTERSWGDLALAAARAGTAAIATTTAPTAETKSAGHDLVTTADRASEAAAIEVILARRPADAIVGEESGSRDGTSGVRWLIDPLDGTANFVHGRPDFAVSVGVEVDGRIVGGAVVRPATGEWGAADAGGLRAGGGPLLPTVTRTPAVRTADALLAVGMPYPLAARRRVLRILAEITTEVRAIRMMGSAAADLLAVARGQADAFVGFGLAPWDIAAGQALVEAAGGVVSHTEIAGLATVIAGPGALVPLVTRLLQDGSTR